MSKEDFDKALSEAIKEASTKLKVTSMLDDYDLDSFSEAEKKEMQMLLSKAVAEREIVESYQSKIESAKERAYEAEQKAKKLARSVKERSTSIKVREIKRTDKGRKERYIRVPKRMHTIAVDGLLDLLYNNQRDNGIAISDFDVMWFEEEGYFKATIDDHEGSHFELTFAKGGLFDVGSY